MPPKSGYRAFKPPRPLTAASSSGKDTKTASKSQQTGAKTATAKGKARAKAPGSFSSDISASDTEDLDDGLGGSVNNTPEAIAKTLPKKRTADEQPAIPPKLLARLTHEHFQHDDTRVTKEAMSVFAKYIEVFTMEAICRANAEREEAAKGNSNMDADFLEVEDLEKLAPQLMLDF